MKKAMLGLAFVMGGTILSAQISVGVRIGTPPAPRVVRVQPRSPGAGYVWVDGYWYPNGRRYAWHDGYWTRPPYASARWIGPRYEGGMFYQGYWDGDRGRNDHDHRWDRDRNNRDYNRYH
jgi:hypothetical protein